MTTRIWAASDSLGTYFFRKRRGHRLEFRFSLKHTWRPSSYRTVKKMKKYERTLKELT